MHLLSLHAVKVDTNVVAEGKEPNTRVHIDLQCQRWIHLGLLKDGDSQSEINGALYDTI